jgi:hypothetical protein
MRLRPDEQPVWNDDGTWSCRRHIPQHRYHATAPRCLMGCPIERPERPGAKLTVVPEPVELPWQDFDQLDADALATYDIHRLRKYAANVLLIRGASKIRGGKPVLIARILKHRRAVA